MKRKQPRTLEPKQSSRMLLRTFSNRKNSSKRRAKFSILMGSRAVCLMGGEQMLDVLCISFAERIAQDNGLKQVYGKLNTIALVQFQKDLLLLALDDGFSEMTQGPKEEVYSQTILQRHVRLGLMDREEYFDRLAYHLDDALAACQISNLEAADRVQRRFEATRHLLQLTKDNLRLLRPAKSTRFRSRFGHVANKMKSIRSKRTLFAA